MTPRPPGAARRSPTPGPARRRGGPRGIASLLTMLIIVRVRVRVILLLLLLIIIIVIIVTMIIIITGTEALPRRRGRESIVDRAP